MLREKKIKLKLKKKKLEVVHSHIYTDVKLCVLAQGPKQREIAAAPEHCEKGQHTACHWMK